MNVEDMMLSEISQPHKEKYLHEIPRVIRFIETESRTVFAGTGGGESGEIVSNENRVSV